MFDFGLKIFLFLSPIIFLPSFLHPLLNGKIAGLQFYQFGLFSNSPALIQRQFFQYGVALLFLLSLFKEQERAFKDKYLGILFLLCAAGVFCHTKTVKSLPDIFLGFLLYYLVVVYTRSVKPLMKIIAAVAILNTIFATLQFFNIGFIYQLKYVANEGWGGSEIFGLMGYKSQLGIYQALALPICYVLNPYLSIIPLVGLLLSKSLTAIIPAAIGMIYLLRNKIRKVYFSYPYMMVLIGVITFLCIWFYHRLSFRFDVWVATLGMIKEKAITGYGLGSFKYIGNTHYADPYGLYLEVAYALGVPGLLALLFFIKSKIWKFGNNTFMAQGIFSSCLILVLCGFGYSFMDYPRLAGTAIVLFGLLAVKKHKQEEEEC